MVLFSEQGSLKKFSTIHEIIDNYCRVRFEFYKKRKEYKLKELEKLIKNLGNKKRFLEEVRDGDLKLFSTLKGKRQSRNTADIVAELEERGYDKNNEEKESRGEDDVEEEVEKRRVGHGYEYLLRMQISSITAEKIDKLRGDIASNIADRDTLEGTSERDIWRYDLEKFLEAYTPYIQSLDSDKKGVKKQVKKAV
jgi:DNA topoisomerase-2